MTFSSQARTAATHSPRLTSTDERLKELGIDLPSAPKPFGAYMETVQSGNLLFLSEMLPSERHGPKLVGRVGPELYLKRGSKAAHLAELNVLVGFVRSDDWIKRGLLNFLSGPF